MGKRNPFKLLYRKFGTKKIVITVVAVFMILSPSILALLLLSDSNEANAKNSSDALTVVMYSHEHEELYREQGKSENYSETSLVGMFNVMKRNLSPINKIPSGTDMSHPIYVDMISDTKTESFTYYFSFAEGGSFCEWNNDSYSVDTFDSERFLSSVFAETLYTNAIPPILTSADGDEILPSQISWNYKNTDSLYIRAEKIPLATTTATYHITSGVSLDFSEIPSFCFVQILDDDTLLFEGSLEDAERLTLDSNTPLSLKISAEWQKAEGCNCFGSAVYEFDVVIHSRAEFSVSSESIAKNGFTVLTATNIADPSRLSFSSEQLDFTPRFVLVNDTAYTLIPCTVTSDTLSFTVKYGVSSKTFNLEVTKANSPENALLTKYANKLGIDPDSIPSVLEDSDFLLGACISPLNIGFTLSDTFGENHTSYYSFMNEYSGGVGTSVASVCGGKVLSVGNSSSLGNYAVVDIGLGLSLVYSNLSCIDVSEGDFLAANENIGKTGNLRLGGNGFGLLLVFDGIILDPNLLFN